MGEQSLSLTAQGLPSFISVGSVSKLHVKGLLHQSDYVMQFFNFSELHPNFPAFYVMSSA